MERTGNPMADAILVELGAPEHPARETIYWELTSDDGVHLLEDGSSRPLGSPAASTQARAIFKRIKDSRQQFWLRATLDEMEGQPVPTANPRPGRAGPEENERDGTDKTERGERDRKQA